MKNEDTEGAKKAELLGRLRVLKRWPRAILEGALNYAEIGKTKYAFTPLLVLFAIALVWGLEESFYEIAGPDIRRDLGLELSVFGAIYSAVGVITIVGGVAVSYYADRRRRTPMVVLGALLFGASCLSMGFVGGAVSLVVLVVLNRTSALVGAIPQSSLLFDYYPPEHRGRVFALMGSLGGIAALASGPLLGLAISRLGWRTTVQSIGVMVLLTGVVAFFLLREPVRGYFERKGAGASEEEALTSLPSSPSFRQGWRLLWSVRTLRRMALADALNYGANGIYGALAAFYVTDQYGLDAFARGQIFFVTSVAGILGALFGGALVDRLTRLSPNRVMLIPASFVAAAALSIALVALGPPLPLFIALDCARSFGMSMVGLVRVALYSQVLHPNVRTLGMQAVIVAVAPGFILLVPLATVVQDAYGYGAAFLLAVPLALAGAAVQLRSARLFAEDRLRVMRESFDAAADERT